jgi:eukaryotic-like serine/threonine-protein kinase
MRLGSRVWGAGKLLVLSGALLFTFVFFFGVSMRVAMRASEVQVPDLSGRSVNEATAILAELGLGLRVDDITRPHDAIPSDRIMQQDPGAGDAARRQRTIRVWLSSGPLVTIVPPLVGETDRTARARADQDGLEIGSISEFRSPDYPADAVVAQDPPPQSQASRVSLLLNRGEQSTTYVMPDVIGMNGERAAEELRRLGFRVSIVGSQPYPGVPPGTVLRQLPPGGFQVAPTDAISLEVSQ